MPHQSRPPASSFPLALVVLPVLLLGCGDDDGGPDPEGADAGVDAGPGVDHVALLAELLTGSFDSVDQAERDPSYFEVRLDVCPLSIPAIGEHVLYVEQALLGMAPYRQRVYSVEPAPAGGGDAQSVVYTLATPALEAALIGRCDQPAVATLEASDVSLREGCEVVVTATADGYAGGTVGTSCASDLNGASYATSQVTVTPTLLESWDQGFDAAGTQVWGAVAGPYEFVRRAAD